MLDEVSFFDGKFAVPRDGVDADPFKEIAEGSFVFRRLQTGLVQNYALLMLFGVLAFVCFYFFMR